MRIYIRSQHSAKLSRFLSCKHATYLVSREELIQIWRPWYSFRQRTYLKAPTPQPRSDTTQKATKKKDIFLYEKKTNKKGLYSIQWSWGRMTLSRRAILCPPHTPSRHYLICSHTSKTWKHPAHSPPSDIRMGISFRNLHRELLANRRAGWPCGTCQLNGLKSDLTDKTQFSLEFYMTEIERNSN